VGNATRFSIAVVILGQEGEGAAYGDFLVANIGHSCTFDDCRYRSVCVGTINVVLKRVVRALGDQVSGAINYDQSSRLGLLLGTRILHVHGTNYATALGIAHLGNEITEPGNPVSAVNDDLSIRQQVSKCCWNRTYDPCISTNVFHLQFHLFMYS
jgi:hypothetical protein